MRSAPCDDAVDLLVAEVLARIVGRGERPPEASILGDRGLEFGGALGEGLTVDWNVGIDEDKMSEPVADPLSCLPDRDA